MISRSPMAEQLAKQVAARKLKPAEEPVAISIDEAGALRLIMRDGSILETATGERAAMFLSRMVPQHFRIGDPMPLGAMFVISRRSDGAIFSKKFDPPGPPN